MSQLSLFKSKRQRGTKLPPPKEMAIHAPIAEAIDRWLMPGWRWTHFPAGELRTKKTAAKLKRMGTKAGVPDLLFFPPRAGAACFIEVKRPGSIYRTTYTQDEWACWCHDNGNPHAIVDSID